MGDWMWIIHSHKHTHTHARIYVISLTLANVVEATVYVCSYMFERKKNRNNCPVESLVAVCAAHTARIINWLCSACITLSLFSFHLVSFGTSLSTWINTPNHENSSKGNKYVCFSIKQIYIYAPYILLFFHCFIPFSRL